MINCNCLTSLYLYLNYYIYYNYYMFLKDNMDTVYIKVGKNAKNIINPIIGTQHTETQSVAINHFLIITLFLL